MLVLRPKRLQPVVVALAGLALALGQAPVNFPYLGLLAVPVLLSILQTCTGKWAAFKLGWVAGIAYFTVSLSWIVEPFWVDITRHGWMAPFAIVLMAGGLALFWGVAFMFSARWMRGRLSDAVILAGFWALLEVLRSVIFTGFPWALLAYGWVETPIIQIVSIVGVHGLGFLFVLASGLLLWRNGTIIALLIGISTVGYGVIRLDQSVVMTDVTVRLIQPNAAQHLKWKPDQIPVFYQRLLALSAADLRADIVIWPEVAIANLPDEQPILRTEIVVAARAPVILGARRRDAQHVYNTLFVIDRGGDIVGQYDKHHLVPFGEYIPLQGLVSQLGLRALADVIGSGIGKGGGPHIVDTTIIPAFLPLICYEAIFPHGMFTQTRAEWMVQITNDAWFGKINGPYQHLAQARVRAIEQGLPLARAANTGISAMVDPFGRITDSLPLGVAGYVDAALPEPLPPTVYSKTGPWLSIVLIILVTLSQLLIVNRKRQFSIEKL